MTLVYGKDLVCQNCSFFDAKTEECRTSGPVYVDHFQFGPSRAFPKVRPYDWCRCYYPNEKTAAAIEKIRITEEQKERCNFLKFFDVEGLKPQ